MDYHLYYFDMIHDTKPIAGIPLTNVAIYVLNLRKSWFNQSFWFKPVFFLDRTRRLWTRLFFQKILGFEIWLLVFLSQERNCRLSLKMKIGCMFLLQVPFQKSKNGFKYWQPNPHLFFEEICNWLLVCKNDILKPISASRNLNHSKTRIGVFQPTFNN